MKTDTLNDILRATTRMVGSETRALREMASASAPVARALGVDVQTVLSFVAKRSVS